ncbi:MAG: prohibitin family protein [Gammaproteobacteria bacterium]|nr:MAG: prohibitin family protein [Gammaproteobacteria bacterium]
MNQIKQIHPPAFHFGGSKAIGLAIIAFLIFSAMSAWVIVDSGHVGVIRTLGAVQPVSLQEGFHWKKPWLDDIVQLDIRLSRATAQAAAASRDLQTVQTQVTLQFSLNGDLAPRTFQRLGKRDAVANTVIGPAIQESVKSITAKYTAEELVTQRAEVKFKIQEAIQKFVEDTLKQKQLNGAINIANVAITDFDFSPEFNKAIELKVRAEQEALQAKNEKDRRVTQAEAAAAERRLAAEAEAYQIEAASKARADAIRREADALKDNPELIQLRIAEKWDGVLPRFSGGGAVPLLNIPAPDLAPRSAPAQSRPVKPTPAMQ